MPGKRRHNKQRRNPLSVIFGKRSPPPAARKQPMDVVFVHTDPEAIRAIERTGKAWAIRLRFGSAQDRYYSMASGKDGYVVTRMGVVGAAPEVITNSKLTPEDVCLQMNQQMDWLTDAHYDPTFYPAAPAPRVTPAAREPRFPGPHAADFELFVSIPWDRRERADADMLIAFLSDSSWTRLDVGDVESVRQCVAGAKRVNFYKCPWDSYKGAAVQWEDGSWSFSTLIPPADAVLMVARHERLTQAAVPDPAADRQRKAELARMVRAGRKP